jgi:hypothetical protein
MDERWNQILGEMDRDNLPTETRQKIASNYFQKEIEPSGLLDEAPDIQDKVRKNFFSTVGGFQQSEDQGGIVSGAINRASDIGVSAAKGIVGLPESMVGIADIVSGGRAGKIVEDSNVKFKETQDILSSMYSPEQQEAFKKVEAANGFIPTVVESVKNPSTIVQSGTESIPSMVGAGGIARAGLKGVAKLAPSVIGKVGAPIVAGAAGEGIISGGQTAEQTRQQSDEGLLTGEQALVSGASGALTSAFGIAGGKLAKFLKINDVDTLLAGGAAFGAKKNILRRAIESAISEGAFEELPQSAQEQIASNKNLGKPLMEGVAEAGASGMLTGGLMGIAGGAYSPSSKKEMVKNQNKSQILLLKKLRRLLTRQSSNRTNYSQKSKLRQYLAERL